MSERAYARRVSLAWLVASLALAPIAFSADLPQRRAAQLEDLRFVRAEYVDKTGASSPAARAAARRYIAKLEQRAGSLSDDEFAVATMRIAAFARNAHDSFDFGDGAALPAKRLPMRFLWFGDALIVARAGPDFANLLGAKVERIEGLAPADLLARLESVSGGIETYRRWNAGWIIENGYLHALGLARSNEKLRLTLRLRDGRRMVRTVDFQPRDSLPSGVHAPRLWSALPYPDEVAHGWRAATEPTRDPLYLQEPEELYRMTRINPIDALYVQFRANDDDAHAIQAFVTGVRKRVEDDHPANLILDLRFDVGGNCDYTRELMRWLPEHIAGRLFVLLGPYTFSAGIVNVAAIKHDGGDRVILVGDLVGDSLRWWSEGHPQCMPNSHLCLRPASRLWDLVNGCAGVSACYGDKYDIRVATLDPAHSAPLTSADWLAGRDRGMEAIMAEFTRVWASKGKVVR